MSKVKEYLLVSTTMDQVKDHLKGLKKIHSQADITFNVQYDGSINCSLTIGTGMKGGFTVETITSGSIENAIYETCLKLEKIHETTGLNKK